MNCSEGFTSDRILRYAMPVGPFNEPAGYDCYMNILAYTVIASILIACNILFFLVLLADFSSKAGWEMKIASLGMMGVSLANLALLLAGIFHQQAGRTAWVAVVGFSVMWVHMYCAKLYFSVELIANKSALHFLGGRVLGWGLIILIQIAASFMFLGALLAAATYDELDQSLAFAFNQASFAGMFVWAVGTTLVFIKVLNQLEAAVVLTGENTKHTKVKEHASTMALREMLFRWGSARKYVIALFPLTVGWAFLHIFVFPVFWYIVLLHVYSTSTALPVVCWYMMTPPKSRAKVVRILTCNAFGNLNGWGGSSNQEGKASNKNTNGEKNSTALSNNREAAMSSALSEKTSFYGAPTPSPAAAKTKAVVAKVEDL